MLESKVRMERKTEIETRMFVLLEHDVVHQGLSETAYAEWYAL